VPSEDDIVALDRAGDECGLQYAHRSDPAEIPPAPPPLPGAGVPDISEPGCKLDRGRVGCSGEPSST
jgi:hypothetical protein